MSKPKRYELTSEQWRRICDLLPGKPADPGRSGANNLTFVNGVLWVLRFSHVADVSRKVTRVICRILRRKVARESKVLCPVK